MRDENLFCNSFWKTHGEEKNLGDHKEKFARLQSLAKGYESKEADQVVEVIKIGS